MMALKKVITEDKIEVVGSKAVQVRTCTQVLENGVEISSGYHRHTILPGEDYSTESEEVRSICDAVHTDAAVKAFNASLKSPDDS